MKKTFAFIAVFLFLMPLALANLEMPWFIGGKVFVNGQAYQGVELTVENLNTGDKFVKVTDGSGSYQIDMRTDFENGVYAQTRRQTGDRVVFKILGGGGGLEKEIVFYDELPKVVDLEFAKDGFVPPVIIEREVVKEVEKEVIKEVIKEVEKEVVKEVEKPVVDVKVVEKEVIKEVEKPIIIETIICEDGTVVNDASECPEASKTGYLVAGVLGALITLVATIIGVFRWGKGYEGMLKYWAKKDPVKAAKMAKTVLVNAKKGKYGKG